MKILKLLLMFFTVFTICGCGKEDELPVVTLNLNNGGQYSENKSYKGAQDNPTPENTQTDDVEAYSDDETGEIEERRNPMDYIGNYEQIEHLPIEADKRSINVISYAEDFPKDLQEHLIWENCGYYVADASIPSTGYYLSPIDRDNDSIFLEDHDDLAAVEWRVDYDFSEIYRIDLNKDGFEDYIVKYSDLGRYDAVCVILKTSEGWAESDWYVCLDVGWRMGIYVLGDDVYLELGDCIARGNGNKPKDDGTGSSSDEGIWDKAVVERNINSYSAKQIFCEEGYTDGIENEIIESIDIEKSLKNEMKEESCFIYHGYFYIREKIENENSDNLYYLFGEYTDDMYVQKRQDILLLFTVEKDESGSERVVSVYELIANYDIGIRSECVDELW